MARRISDEDIRRAAALAKLELRPEELPAARRDLEDMLDAIEALRSIDISGTAPMYTIDIHSRSLRQDQPLPSSMSTISGSLPGSVIARATTLPPPEWKLADALSGHNTPGSPEQTSAEHSRDSLHPGVEQP